MHSSKLIASTLAVFCTLSGTAALAQNFTAEAATDWTSLFDRHNGWTGADGIYSIPLDGGEMYSARPNRRTAFVFSDTFIGRVDENNRRQSGTVLVNNTMALLKGPEADPSRIAFFWGRNSEGNPDALFKPDTPNSEPGEWYWLGDGAAINGKVHIFAYRIRSNGGGGAFGFEGTGLALLTMPLDVPNPYENLAQVDCPAYIKEPSGGRGEIVFGTSIMMNTEGAGAPNPDGYVYIYGIQNDQLIKKLLVARVLPEQFEDFTAWRYWDGATWSADVDQAATLTGRVSSECSVSPLPNGKYILVYQEDTLGPWVSCKIGDSPVGPFGQGIHLWHCDEVNQMPDAFVYNAKAHPHLSKPGELLISYNVNNLDFWYHFENSAAYRPRFIRVKFNQ
ncbi:MAG: DUF4185 domain-containing protein [Phycisphaerales bacterium]|nr:DUF4185 domain-containing protein [Phycisphaerales bacterium]